MFFFRNISFLINSFTFYMPLLRESGGNFLKISHRRQNNVKYFTLCQKKCLKTYEKCGILSI